MLSVQAIIHSLGDLVSIHKNLIAISEQKTEIVKEGSVEKLQKLLLEEHKQIRILEKAENERQKKVENWFLEEQLPPTDRTITRMLEVITNEQDNKHLEKTTIALTNAITKLKQQEQLNQALIEQSMQFVQVSLNTMNPSLKNMNYGNKSDKHLIKRSAFDSKA